MSKLNRSFYLVKATFSGKSTLPNVKIKGYSNTGIIVTEGKKPTQQQIKDFCLAQLDFTCEDPTVIPSQKVEVKKLTVDFFLIYK